MLKINFDGAFIKESRRGAWGFIIRDQQGDGVAAGSGDIQNLHDALQAEVQVCIAALRYAQQLGVSRVVLETD